jgi:hypothetical protein
MIARLAMIATVAALCMYGTSGYALTQKECSDKYNPAKAGGTLNGQTWNAFRKAECGSEAATPVVVKETEKKAPTKETEKKTPPAKMDPAPTSNAVFPTAISPKYSTESAGKARMHTCLDQYNVNKANNANGGLKWIQKGGGYYSECNKRLKV